MTTNCSEIINCITQDLNDADDARPRESFFVEISAVEDQWWITVALDEPIEWKIGPFNSIQEAHDFQHGNRYKLASEWKKRRSM